MKRSDVILNIRERVLLNHEARSEGMSS